MTPTTPPAIPSDIPAEVWDMAVHNMTAVGWHAPSMIIGAARAIMAERARCEDCVAALIRNGFMLEGEQTFADLIINAIREAN